MLEMQAEVEELILAIKKTDAYMEYHRLLALLKEEPEVKEAVDEYRKKVYLFQTASLDRVSYEEQTELEQERDQLYQNPLVEEYLVAESAFCFMMQQMQQEIIASIDFD
ncbi:MAG: YlbF family regulator [Lachnospiraceae bacterium]